MPFKFLAREARLCENARFIDVDYRELILKKCERIQECTELSSIIADASLLAANQTVILKGQQYVALAVDLQRIEDLKILDHVLGESNYSTLFIAEVSMTYLAPLSADSVLSWASRFDDGKYEEHWFAAI